MRRIFYFAYGSNMLLERLEWRVNSVLKLGTYRLKDYKLVFNCGYHHLQAYANIIHSLGDSVEGVIYHLTEKQIAILDRYENYPDGYEKFYFLDQAYESGAPNDIIFGYHSVSKHYQLGANCKPVLGYLDILIAGCIENDLLDTYNRLVEYRGQHYKLTKGNKFRKKLIQKS